MGNTFGAAVATNFTLTGADALPQTLYLIAKAYDSSNNEIPDSDSMDNILIVANDVIVKADLVQVNAPVTNPFGGTFSGTVSVMLSSATDGANIYYTTDGTEPTTSSTLYSGAFTLSATTTVKAIAVKAGMTDSTVLSVTFTKSTSGSTGGGGAATYTVTFETNGGSAVKSVSVTSGGKATKPSEPTKEGYTFGGWFSDKELTKEFDFNKGITGNTAVYAKWTEKSVDPTDPHTEWQNPFADVKKGDWFYGDVEYAHINGLFAGTGADTFSPNDSMTRAMLATVMWRMAGSPSANGTPFIDVASGMWYSDAVAWAKVNGIVSGIGGGLFDPDAEITREQMATILYRYEQFSGKIPADIVADREMIDFDTISGYAKNAVNVLVAQGIISGKPGNVFDPQGTATRAEVAAMLHRFIKAAELSEEKHGIPDAGK